MKTRLIAILLLAALAVSCDNYEDFEFSGQVVYYEECTQAPNLGYIIVLDSPDSVGGPYVVDGVTLFNNAVVVYGADRLLAEGDRVKGRIYLDPKYSKTECWIHYNREAVEARFTKLEIID